MSRADSQNPDHARAIEGGFEPGPTHEAAAVVLDNLSVPVGAAETHGMLSGLLCSQPSGVAKTRWFTELLDAAGLEAASLASKAADVRALDGWFTASAGALNDAELGFTPLLPDDEVSLTTRLQALADFCAGFNYGLGIGIAGRGSRPLPDDTAEIVRDFQAIEATAADPESAGAEDEGAFVELVEYVRVGVLLVHEELRPVMNLSGANRGGAPATPSSSTDPKVH